MCGSGVDERWVSTASGTSRPHRSHGVATRGPLCYPMPVTLTAPTTKINSGPTTPRRRQQHQRARHPSRRHPGGTFTSCDRPPPAQVRALSHHELPRSPPAGTGSPRHPLAWVDPPATPKLNGHPGPACRACAQPAPTRFVGMTVLCGDQPAGLSGDQPVGRGGIDSRCGECQFVVGGGDGSPRSWAIRRWLSSSSVGAVVRLASRSWTGVSGI